MRGNYKFIVDGYRSFKDIVSMELTTLKEMKIKYWEKVLTPGIFPEDRIALVSIIMYLENEIMLRELNIKMYCS